MAKMSLASLINPHPCNAQQEERNWQALQQVFQIFDEIFNISVTSNNTLEYNIQNITNLEAVQIDVTNVDVTNNLTTNTFNATTVEIVFLDVAYIDSYSIVYQILYDDTTEVCPPACGVPSGGDCPNCTDVDMLAATVYLDIEWPSGGGTETITMTKYDEQLASEGLGVCWKKYSGTGNFGVGNSSTNYKLWVQTTCIPGGDIIVAVDSEFCTASYAGSEDDITTWPIQMSNTSASPLDGDATWPGDSISCGYHPGEEALLDVHA